MRPIQCLAFAAAVLLLAGVAVAEDEIVHFTNGTSMAVRSHTVEGGMVKVDLGKESYMAFPLVMVEKITKAGRELDLTGGPSNRAVGSDAGGSGGGGPRVLSAEGQVPARYRAGRTTRGSMDQETLDKLNRALGIEEGGTVTTPIYRPRSTNPKMRSLTAIQNPMQYQAQTQGVQSPLMRMPNGRNVMVPSDTGMSGANPHSAPPRAGATRMRLNDQTATLAAADGSTAAAGPKSPPPPPPSDGGTSTQGGSR